VSAPRRAHAVLVAAGLLLPIFLWLLAGDERAAQLEWSQTEETGESALPAPAAESVRSRWVSQSATPVIALGETATLSFAFRNVGSTRWVRGTAAEARLGIVDDDRRFYDLGFSVGWAAPDRLAVQDQDIVDVGEVATFTFAVRGTVTGLHHIRVRPVIDGVTWMDDEGAYLDVIVSAT
jgi:hypothetical protein